MYRTHWSLLRLLDGGRNNLHYPAAWGWTWDAIPHACPYICVLYLFLWAAHYTSGLWLPGREEIFTSDFSGPAWLFAGLWFPSGLLKALTCRRDYKIFVVVLDTVSRGFSSGHCSHFWLCIFLISFKQGRYLRIFSRKRFDLLKLNVHPKYQHGLYM